MAPKNYPTPIPNLSEVKEQFKIWRKTRNSPRPIPEKLWNAAVSLSANHTVSQIAEELIIDHDDLKKACAKKKKLRKKAPPPTFIELDVEQPPAVSECIVEMQDILGAKMRMHFRGKTDIDLLEFVEIFWRKRP